MIIFLKISIISTLITISAGLVMWYFSRYDFDYKDIYNEGIDLYRQKNYKGAISKFELVITKFPNKYQSYYNAGLCELKLKLYDKARQHFLDVLKINPNDADTIYNLGYTEYYSKNYEKAKEYFMSVLEYMPDESDLLFSIGSIEQKEENYPAAKDYMEKAITLSPEKNIYKKYLQDVLEKLFEDSNDMDIMKQILDLSLELLVVYPDDENIIYRAAVAYAQMGDWSNSINYCERLYNKNPLSSRACSQYGLALFCKGEINEAIEMYEKAVKLAPDIPDTYMNLVFAYDKIQDTENALSLAEGFLKKFPNDPSAEMAKDFIERKTGKIAE